MKKIYIAFLLTVSTIMAAKVVNAATVDHKKFVGNYRGANFVGRKDLRFATFQGDFSGAKFTGCDLTGAEITSDSIAIKASFKGAIMRGFKFHNVNAAGSNFEGADLTRALVSGRFSDGNFKTALLDFVNAQDSNFDRAVFDFASLYKFQGTSSSFFKTRLYRTTILGSVLFNVNMGLSDVTRAVIFDNDMRKINQYHVKWPRTTYFIHNRLAGAFSELANPQ